MSARTTLEGVRLTGAIRQVLPAAGDLPNRDYPAALLVEVREDGVRLVATDGHRLGVRDLPASTSGSGRVVVDSTDAARIASIVENVDAVALNVDGALTLDIAGAMTRINAVRDHYPDYEAVLKRTGSSTLLVNSQDLAQQLAATNDVVVFSLSERECTANGLPVAGRYKGDDVRIAFNPTYLAEGLSSGIGPDLILHLGGPLDPVLIGSADDGGFSWLVMPIRL